MTSSFTLLRVRGIPIGANWTWLVVFALVAWSLATGLFPRTYPGLDDSAYIAMGLTTAVFFFGSILLHELGHAFRALKEGMEIDGITLWIFGGVARFRGMFPSAGAEARIALAGPLVTLVLAVLFGAVTWFANQAGWPDALIGVTDYLARINAIVLGFNLVPALPLDGGRVLRAYLWHRQESFTAATMSAAKAGRAFGGVLIGVGILGLFTGSGLGGIWFAFIGWFLLQAAQAEAAAATIKQALGGIAVSELMTKDPVSVTPDTRIEDFIERLGDGRRHSTFPVVDSKGELVGLVGPRLAAKIPSDQRHSATVADVMLPRESTPTARPKQSVAQAVESLQQDPGRAVVVSNGHPVGILSGSDIVRALEVESLRTREEEPGARRAPWFVWLVVGAIMVVAAGYLYRPPVVVISPGEVVDITQDVTISGVPTDRVEGSYLLTSVALTQPNGLGAALSFVRGRDILPVSSVIPEGVEPDEFLRQQREIFRESRIIAAAAAAQSVGMDVQVSGAGGRVMGVAPGSPAAGKLEAGDVIRSVDGRSIRTSSDLTDVIRSSPLGSEFRVEFDRNGARRAVTLRSRDLPQTEGAVIGVLVRTADLEVDLPFEVRFRDRPVGGPSAGTAYALAIADLLDPGDVAGGRAIASTGTMSLTGEVGAVGGVDEKARAAEAADADLFIVPAAEVDAARGEGHAVRGVETLREALDLLARTA